MTDNIITGRAKKHDGTAIDYVSIFNWSDGQCIAQVAPDASGVWSYPYFNDLRVGLTYVADGCEPVTHGAYDIAYQAPIEKIPTDYILAYDFNGNTLDKSVNALDGVRNGSTVFSTGRKEGTQALEFINGNVKTSKAMPINSDKLTISFWMSTSQSSSAFIYEQDIGGYGLWCGINIYSRSKIESYEQSASGGNLVLSPMPFNDTYQHVLIEIDRSKPALEENKIYINNVLNSAQGSLRAKTNGNIDNLALFIGSGRSGSEPFIGKIQDMRFYNRVLTEVERAQLFNE